jgi:hypothetical protein
MLGCREEPRWMVVPGQVIGEMDAKIGEEGAFQMP